MPTVRHRDGAALSLSRRQLRKPCWVHPCSGIAVPAAEADDFYSLCLGIRHALAVDAVYTHVTSAMLRGWWLPECLHDAPVVACTNGEAPHHNRRGVYVRRCEIPTAHRGWVGELPVASAEWTIIELAEHLSLIDLVVLVDGALHLGDCTVESIRKAMIRGRRGVRVLRVALDLCDGRSESPWESILRLVHVLAGLTEIDTQFVVCDERGQVIARADLRIRGSRRLVEYDGADHRTKEQHRDDLRREKALLRCGWERYGYTAFEVHRDPGRIISDAEVASGLEHDPTRVADWFAHYHRSALSDRGRRELTERMARFVRDSTPRPRAGNP